MGGDTPRPGALGSEGRANRVARARPRTEAAARPSHGPAGAPAGRPKASHRSRVAGVSRPPQGCPWWPDEHGPQGSVHRTGAVVPRASGHASACQPLRERWEAVDAPRDRGPAVRSATARGPSGGPSSFPGPGPRAPTRDTGSSDPCIGGSEGVAPPASAFVPTGVHHINPLPSAFHMEMRARPRAGRYMRGREARAHPAITFALRAIGMTFVRGAEGHLTYPNSGSAQVKGNIKYRWTPHEAPAPVPAAPPAAPRSGPTPAFHMELALAPSAGPGMVHGRLPKG